MSLLNKIMKGKKEETSMMSPDQPLDTTNQMENPMFPSEQPEITQEEEMYSEYEDEDMDALIEYGPLGAIKELIKPMALQATDRQFMEFFYDLMSDRKEVMDNL